MFSVSPELTTRSKHFLWVICFYAIFYHQFKSAFVVPIYLYLFFVLLVSYDLNLFKVLIKLIKLLLIYLCTYNEGIIQTKFSSPWNSREISFTNLLMRSLFKFRHLITLLCLRFKIMHL